MDPIIAGLLLGGAAGGLKHLFVDKPEQERKKKMAFFTQLFSPWTGLKAEAVPSAQALGPMLQGAGAGAAFGQGLSKAKSGGEGDIGSVVDPVEYTMPSESTFWNRPEYEFSPWRR